MIRINRGPCPRSLKGEGGRQQGDRYNTRQVVSALWRMQHRKCCYCEQEIPEHGHLKAVEHFRPKAVFTGLRNDWQNLLLACAQCNGKKSDLFPVVLSGSREEVKVVYLKFPAHQEPMIIDPCRVNPEQHLDFLFDGPECEGPFGPEYLFPVLVSKNGSVAGRKTIEVIGLDSAFFTRAHFNRYELLELTYMNLVRAHVHKEADKVVAYKERYMGYMTDSAPLAALARSFARYKQLDRRFGITIPDENEPTADR